MSFNPGDKVILKPLNSLYENRLKEWKDNYGIEPNKIYTVSRYDERSEQVFIYEERVTTNVGWDKDFWMLSYPKYKNFLDKLNEII